MKHILISLLCLSLIIDIVLVIFSVTRSEQRRTAPLTLLCCALLIYTLGYTAELTATTSEGVFIALIVENFGIAHISILFLLTCISLFCPSSYRHLQLVFACLYGMIFFVIVLTNPSHQLYYREIHMVPEKGELFARLSRGPLYVLHQMLNFIFLAISYLIIAWQYLKSPGKVRRQMILFILGSLLALAACVLNYSSLLATYLDPTPFFIAAGLAVFSLSLVKADWIDIVAKARWNALEHLNDSFIVLDKDSDFLYCNQTAQKLFPSLAQFPISEPINRLSEWPEALYKPHAAQNVSFTMPDSQAQLHHYQTTIKKIYGNSGMLIGYSYLIHDDTEATDLILQLESMATTDPLTGILNRRSLFDRIQYELTLAQCNQQSCMLIMFDLDHFKRINDTYSHQVGDVVLQQTVSTIKKQLRHSDSFGRIGGEEFVIFSQSFSPPGVMPFAERLRSAVAAMKIATEQGTITVTASFGITEVTAGSCLTAAIANADVALYEAKSQGRNCIVLGAPTIAPAPDSSNQAAAPKSNVS